MAKSKSDSPPLARVADPTRTGALEKGLTPKQKTLRKAAPNGPEERQALERPAGV